MAFGRLSLLHSDLLELLTGELNINAEGLAMAAKHARRSGIIDGKLQKRLANLEIAIKVAKHATTINCRDLAQEVVASISKSKANSGNGKIDLLAAVLMIMMTHNHRRRHPHVRVVGFLFALVTIAARPVLAKVQQHIIHAYILASHLMTRAIRHIVINLLKTTYVDHLLPILL